MPFSPRSDKKTQTMCDPGLDIATVTGMLGARARRLVLNLGVGFRGHNTELFLTPTQPRRFLVQLHAAHRPAFVDADFFWRLGVCVSSFRQRALHVGLVGQPAHSRRLRRYLRVMGQCAGRRAGRFRRGLEPDSVDGGDQLLPFRPPLWGPNAVSSAKEVRLWTP